MGAEKAAADIGKFDSRADGNASSCSITASTLVIDGLVSGIQGLIDGTAGMGRRLSDVLGNLGNMLLQFGLQLIRLVAGLGGIPWRSADGGILPTNGPAIVGERP